jgi:hypothetical protein
MTELTAATRIQNQINNTESLSKFIQPTGVGQEYTPIINFTELGFDLLNTIPVQLESKKLGLEISNGQELKMVYSELNCVTNYENTECFGELHHGINSSYQKILGLAIENAAQSGQIDENDKTMFLSQVAEIKNTVDVRQDKPRVRLKH